MDQKISREELVKIYNIELHFFDDLEEFGLLNTITENNIKYIVYEELPFFERLTNWHYDLDVNLPGLQVLHHLFEKLQKQQEENRMLLKSKLLNAPLHYTDEI